MSARLLGMLGVALIAGAIANEVTNFPVTLSQLVLVLIVGLGGLCLAAFLVILEAERQREGP